MTRPSRTAHFAVFAVLAVLLPVVFIGGIAVRKPLPVSASTGSPLVGRTFDVVGKDYRFRFVIAGGHIQFTSGTYALHPDVLVYSTEGASTFPSNAQLVGPLRVGDRTPLPPAESLVLFSLGHQKVIASVGIRGAP